MALQDPNAILASLQGEAIQVPDLQKLFKNWPQEVNPCLDQLRQEVNDWLESSMSHSRSLSSLKAADFGLFGATWWPHASPDRLRIVTLLAVWLFTWDDELDMDDGSLWDDFGRSQIYRAETLDYVRLCLELPTRESKVGAEPTSIIIRNFDTIGTAIRDVYTIEQRERFSYQMKKFMDMTEREQWLRINQKVPTVEQYLEYRLGSSAIRFGRHAAAVVDNGRSEYENVMGPNKYHYLNVSLIFGSEIADVERLDLKLRPVDSVNDILSLKKEVTRSSVLSLIPLLYSRLGSAQAATDQAIEVLIVNIAMFEEAAKELLASHLSPNMDCNPQLEDFVKGCRLYCSGNLAWSLSTHRYGVNKKDKSNELTINLGSKSSK